jgi:hypothetical protein
VIEYSSPTRSARYMKGPPQVHRRSVRGHRKLARHGPAGNPVHLWPVVPFCRLRVAQAGAVCFQRGSATQPGGTVPPQSKAIPRYQQVLATVRGSRGPCVGQTGRLVIVRATWRLLPRMLGHRNPGASGSVNRSSGPDSVRHMSVTTAMQGLTAAHRETQRDNSKTARESGKIQLTGYFRRWWQVLGSNQRRLSRRFYRPSLLAEADAADQRLRGSRRCPGAPSSAICPCAPGSGRWNARTGTDGGARSGHTQQSG